MISKMDNRADYKKAIVAFVVSALFMGCAVFSLPTIILSPQMFTTMFTMSMLCLLFALAFLNGPATYITRLTQRTNIIASALMMASIVFALYFSVIDGNYLLSLLFCFLEVILISYNYSSTLSYYSFVTPSPLALELISLDMQRLIFSKDNSNEINNFHKNYNFYLNFLTFL